MATTSIDPRSKRLSLLDVSVDPVNMETALDAVKNMMSGEAASVILAVNPEKIMAARHDRDLHRALSGADLLIPDGIGVVLAAKLLRLGSMKRVPGSELMPEICRFAAADGRGVFLFGGKPGVAERTGRVLTERYTGLTVAGTQHGYLADADMADVVARVNASGAEILFVALGSPRQEYWIEHHRGDLKVKVCQGVGGTFDVICGDARRAPLVFRKLNLEWFYRLATNPGRVRRQAALPLFAAQILAKKLRGR